MMEMTDKLNPLPTLVGDRIVLRKLRLSDAEAMYKEASNPEVTNYLRWEPHTSLAQSEAYIRKTIEKCDTGEEHLWVIAEKTADTLIGTIALMKSQYKPRAEIGYWLGREHWGKEYMTEAVKLLLHYCFTALELVRVQATHSVENPASGRVMQKAGMTLEGVLRQYCYYKGQSHDGKLYSIVKGDSGV